MFLTKWFFTREVYSLKPMEGSFIYLLFLCMSVCELYPYTGPLRSTCNLIIIPKSLVMARNKSRSSLPWCSGNCLTFIFKPSPYLNLLSLAYHTWDHLWTSPLLQFRYSPHWHSLQDNYSSSWICLLGSFFASGLNFGCCLKKLLLPTLNQFFKDPVTLLKIHSQYFNRRHVT